MYEQTFQFSSRPFNSVPRLEDFFAGISYQQAMDVAYMCVDRSTGPVVLVGSVGMGKSLMLQKIAQSFESRFDIVRIECSRLEQRTELLQSILFELDLPYSGLSEGELRLSLMRYLKQNEQSNDGLLLLVDEADRLSVELIDELRLITNQLRDGRSIVQLVLAGTQRLEDSLTDAKLASFNQRIAARCVLQNLNKKETEQFIYQHVKNADRQGEEIFDSEAIDEIHHNTDGCPRLINQLCDQSLILAASRNKQPVDRALIREAWAEMQNMPILTDPFDAGFSNAADDLLGQMESGSVVEFGQLGDSALASSSENNLEIVGDEDPFTPNASDEPQNEIYEEASDDSTEEQTESDEASDTQEEPTHSTPSGLQFVTPALGGLAAFSSDPFAPQNEEERLEDGNTESDRISSLEQEQNDLFEQIRHQQNNVVDDSSDQSDEEVRTAFEVLGLNEQGIEPPIVDEMIPADPFRLPSESADSVDPDVVAEDERDDADDASPLLRATEDTVGSIENECTYDQNGTIDDTAHPRSLNKPSIEDQLGLTDPEPDEPSSYQPPSFEQQPVVEPNNFDSSTDGDSSTGGDELPENTDAPTSPYAHGNAVDPFAETFEEEEMLQDAYSPFVAQQNQASLEVTSDQLSHLTPLDEGHDPDQVENANPWNAQTPELAIEELDETEVSADSPESTAGFRAGNVESIGTGDFVSNEPLQEEQDFEPTHSSAPPKNLWQLDPATQFQLPDLVETETPSTFVPIPSVPNELGPVSFSKEEIAHEISATTEDPFAPQGELAEKASAEAPLIAQSYAPPVDEDLEALTKDLDSAATFDYVHPQNSAENPADDPERQPPVQGGSLQGGMMDLNDLVPSHMLQDMEASNVAQSHSIVQPESQSTAIPTEYPRDNFAARAESTNLGGSYSPHAEIDGLRSPTSSANDEARRNTEEFTRTFNARREIEAASEIEASEQLTSEQLTSEQLQSHQQPQVQADASDASTPIPKEQSQEILREIFSQQQILDQVHYTDGSQPEVNPPAPGTIGMGEQHDSQQASAPHANGADSVSVECPVTEYEGYQQPGNPPAEHDDRDMLYVNESQQYSPPETPPTPPHPPFPNVTTSTGNAERMDYNQLFDQLRNAPEQ